MTHRRADILTALTARRDELHRFGVRSLALFGSAARNEAGPESDLDFLVELRSETFDSYMGLKEYLEGVFACRVDLVLADAVKPRLKPIIFAEAVRVPGL